MAVSRCLAAALWLGTGVAVVLGTSVLQAAPENVCLVVNGRGWASNSIANHYVDLRGLFPTHVVRIDYDGDPDRMATLEEFRRVILDRVAAECRRRGIAEQIEYIVYSADFPYAVPFPPGASKDPFPEGSLTGLTFLHRQLSSVGEAFRSPTANDYALQSLSIGKCVSRRQYMAKRGARSSSGLQEYPLSTMLGFVGGRGNSYAEVVSYLRRAAMADSSHPTGSFFFMRNPDVRSTTRSGGFPDIVAALSRAGFDARIEDGVVPPPDSRVIGAVLGSPSFLWPTTSSIVPGAICENFTSFGGILTEDASQTPLTSLLRAGATASSGTVIEPYSIPHKFPNPAIHALYVQGCTMGEAFYQSVLSPYQLLIVGDPLSRPWGIRLPMRIRGLPEKGPVTGSIELRCEVALPADRSPREVRYYLDGKLLARGEKLDAPIRFESDGVSNGFHSVTAVVDVTDTPSMENRVLRWIEVANPAKQSLISVSATPTAAFGDKLNLEIDSEGCDRIVIHHLGEQVGVASAGKQTISILTADLGLGPATLQAIGYLDGQERYRARPTRVLIDAPRVRAASQPWAPQAGSPGFILRDPSGTPRVIKSSMKANWLQEAGIAANSRLQIEAQLPIAQTDLFQFRAHLQGQLQVRLNGRTIFDGDGRALRFGMPVHLARGNHTLECRILLRGAPAASLAFGNEGCRSLGELNCRHVPSVRVGAVPEAVRATN